MTTRHLDWQSRLAAFLAGRMATPFAWGTHDCCIFACDAVLAQTGHDPADGLRAHRTAQEAAQTLADHGGVAALATARLGPEILPTLAAVGDVGLVQVDGRDALAVCAGSFWLAPGASGLASLPHDRALRAWRAV